MKPCLLQARYGAVNMASSKAMTVLAKTQPARTIDRIRRIWPDIEEYRRSHLTWQQIASIVAGPDYGIKVTYKTFMAASYRIRASSVLRQSRPQQNHVSMLDPIETAKQKLMEEREMDERMSGKRSNG